MVGSSAAIGRQMWGWANDLFPICRSITGPGVRETLAYLSDLLPALTIHSVPSGTPVFDWVVPNEWTIRDAYVADENGERVIDFRKSNLHLMGYSVPLDRWVSRDELDHHLHSLPDQPDAIPYRTSYYTPDWGFCLAHNDRIRLTGERYRVVIDSDLKPGVLNYGELILPGQEDDEILLSTYICHPSLANNELSGPVVTAALGQWLSQLEGRRYTYRIIFIPETIGAIAYIARNLDVLRRRTIGGFIITCVGDDRAYSYLPSRQGGRLSDRAALYALSRHADRFERYTFLDRGSDERQFNSPGVDLSLCSIMRSRYGSYPEYHTSLDNMSLITPDGLGGAYEVLRTAISAMEANRVLMARFPCEPRYSKYGLRSTLLAGERLRADHKLLSDLVAYADGTKDLLELSELFGRTMDDLDAGARLLETLDIVSSSLHTTQAS